MPNFIIQKWDMEHGRASNYFKDEMAKLAAASRPDQAKPPEPHNQEFETLLPQIEFLESKGE